MRPVISGLVTAATCIVIPTAAHAYCPRTPRDYTVQHEFGRSKYVVEAIVERETWLGENGRPKPLRPPFQFNQPRPWGFDPYIGAYFDVRVLKAFKGKAPQSLRLFSENSTARFWLKSGRKYLLFVSEAKFDASVGRALTIDTCGNSADLKGDPTLLRTLEQLGK